MTDPQTLMLPILESKRQTLLNQMLTGGEPLELDWRDRRLRFCLADQQSSPLHPTLVIELIVGTHRFRLGLERIDWLGQCLTAQITKIHPQLAAGLLEAALDPLLQQLEQFVGEPTRLHVHALDPDQCWRGSDYEPEILLTIQEGQAAPEKALLCLPERSGEYLIQLLEKRQQLTPDIWDRCPIMGHLRIGTLWLHKQETAQWQSGDVLLLTNGSHEETGYLGFGGHHLWRGRWQEGSFILEALMNENQEKEPYTLVEDQPSSALLDDLDSIEIPLHFEIGVRRFTFAEIKAMRPGTGIDLGRDLQKPVTIRTGGTAIAKGELVRIDDRLGVRLVEVIGHASH